MLIDEGLANFSEERMRDGVFKPMTAEENLIIENHTSRLYVPESS